MSKIQKRRHTLENCTNIDSEDQAHFVNTVYDIKDQHQNNALVVSQEHTV